MDAGIGPEIEFDDKDRIFRDVKPPNELGNTPMRLFDEKFRTSRFLS